MKKYGFIFIFILCGTLCSTLAAMEQTNIPASIAAIATENSPTLNFTIDEDLRLEVAQPHHAPGLFAILDKNRDELSLGIPMVCKLTTTLQKTQDLIQITITGFENRERLFFVIIYKEEMVGAIWLHHIDKKDLHAEFGTFLVPEARRKGLIKRAGQKVLEFGFLEWQLNRFYIVYHEGNEASYGLAKRCGFKFVAAAETEGTITYCLKKCEWQAKQLNQTLQPPQK